MMRREMRNLVLLPGFMCDADLWSGMGTELAALGRAQFGNVYEDDTLEGMARRVLDAAPARFVLIGFSMGGFVARVTALMAPERVHGIAFIATSARGSTPAEEAYKARRLATLGKVRVRADRPEISARALHPDRERDPVLLERLLPCRAGSAAKSGRANSHWYDATVMPISSASPVLRWWWPAARTACANSRRPSAWRGICRTPASK